MDCSRPLRPFGSRARARHFGASGLRQFRRGPRLAFPRKCRFGRSACLQFGPFPTESGACLGASFFPLADGSSDATGRQGRQTRVARLVIYLSHLGFPGVSSQHLVALTKKQGSNQTNPNSNPNQPATENCGSPKHIFKMLFGALATCKHVD